MIVYNFPYRGPFEYEKFLLNAFQLKNFSERKRESLLGEKSALKAIEGNIDKQIKEMTELREREEIYAIYTLLSE